MKASSVSEEQARKARQKQHSDEFLEIDGPLDEVQRLADLTMAWWHMYTEKHDMKVLGQPGVHFNEREIEIMSFALGEIWQRLKAINAVLERPYTGDAVP